MSQCKCGCKCECEKPDGKCVCPQLKDYSLIADRFKKVKLVLIHRKGFKNRNITTKLILNECETITENKMHDVLEITRYKNSVRKFIFKNPILLEEYEKLLKCQEKSMTLRGFMSKYSSQYNKNNKHYEIYKGFLNDYGDLKYCRFEMEYTTVKDDKGLYAFSLNNKPLYIGRTTENYKKRINTGYGDIKARNLLRDGQSTNCRINSLINHKKVAKVSLWVRPMSNDCNEKIKDLEKDLIKKYNPLWNLQ